MTWPRSSPACWGAGSGYLHLPSGLFYVLLRLTGSDPFTAERLRHQFADVMRHGRDDAAVSTETVRSLTGTAPCGFAEFAATP